MAEWAHLPKDLLESISNRLESSTYLLRFRSVCSSWRSSVSPKLGRLSGTFRILPNDGISCTSFGFRLSRRTIFLVKPPPDSQDQTGSCHSGWVVKIEEDVRQRKHLLNPLSTYPLNPLPQSFPRVLDMMCFSVSELGREYVLRHVNFDPMFSEVENLYMEKVAMVWLGSGSLFVLLTIHVSGKLAMFRSGDKQWTIIQDMPSLYDDVIVYAGRFFAVDNTGRTVVVGVDSELGLAANPVFGGDKKYLVESRGELLLVDMYLSIEAGERSYYMSARTVKFKVFRLDEEAQSWIEMKSLGDRVLFLGNYSTFSASATDLSRCDGDCIIFVDNFFYAREKYEGVADDGVLAGRDIRVFELDSGNIGPLRNYPQYSKMFWPPPHWVT